MREGGWWGTDASRDGGPNHPRAFILVKDDVLWQIQYPA